MSPDAQPELITLKQIAERANVSPAAVSNWRKRHASTFPPPVSGNLYDSARVDEWLGRHEDENRSKQVKPIAGKPRQPVDLFKDLNVPLAMRLALLATAALARHGDPNDPLELARTVEAREDLPLSTASHIVESYLRHIDDASRRELHQRFQSARELWVSSQPTRTSVAHAFDELLHASGRAKGSQEAQSHGSSAIAEVIARLSSASAQSVLDMASGYGGLLLKLAPALPGPVRIEGQEFSQETCAVASMRMALHGLDVPISEVDSLDVDSVENSSQFDLVVCEPPFGTRVAPDSAVVQKIQQDSGCSIRRGELAWLYACLLRVGEGGQVFIVLPQLVASRGGVEAELRRELLGRGCVVAVAGLPDRLAVPHAGGASLWVLTTDRSNPPPVFMFSCADERDLGRLVNEFDSWQRDPNHYVPIKPYSASISVHELMRGDANLDPSIYTRQAGNDLVEEFRTALGRLQTVDNAVVKEIHGLSNRPWEALVGSQSLEARTTSLGRLQKEGLIEIIEGLPQEDGEPQAELLLDGQGAEVAYRIVGDTPRYQLRFPAPTGHTALAVEGDVVASRYGGAYVVCDRETYVCEPLFIIRRRAADPRADPWLLAQCLTATNGGPGLLQRMYGGRPRNPQNIFLPELSPKSATEFAELARRLQHYLFQVNSHLEGLKAVNAAFNAMVQLRGGSASE